MLSIALFFTYLKREDVLAQREERKTTLENLLFDARQQLKDHQSGTNILTDDELADYVQKVEIFAKRIRKLSLQPSEMEIEHILEREKKKRMAYEDKLRRQEEL